MKKSFLILAAILLAVLLIFAGCGEKPEPDKASRPTVTTANEDDSFLVTFNSNGGSKVSSRIVEKGEKVSRPADPEKPGYTFEGWLCEGEEWSFTDDAVTEDVTLNAKWSAPIVYTITYDLAGGEFPDNPNPTSSTVESDAITFTGTPTRDRYLFAGWTLSGIPRRSCGNKTVTAKWEIAGFQPDALGDYVIVYASAPVGLSTVAQSLRDAIREATGKTLPVYRDTSISESEREILVGNTNRSLSQNCYAETSSIMRYEMVVEKDTLQLVVGGPYSGMKCVQKFQAEVLSRTDLLTVGPHFGTDLATDSQPLTAGADVRVMSSNVLAYRWGEKTNPNVYPAAIRCEIYAGVLLRFLPDVVGVQETDEPWLEALPYYLEMMAEKEKIPYTHLLHYVAHKGKNVINYSPILYRSDLFKLDDVGCDVFEANYQTSYCQRVGTYAKFTSKTDPTMQLILVNSHWAHETEARILSCVNEEAALVKRLENLYPNVPVFCTADFNSDSTRKPTNETSDPNVKTRDQYFLQFVEQIEGIIASDAARAKGVLITPGGCRGSASYMNEDKPRALDDNFIDHIVVSGGYANVLRHDTIRSNGCNVMTDHSPIYADFSLKEPTT